jgi:hypothetical protein
MSEGCQKECLRPFLTALFGCIDHWHAPMKADSYRSTLLLFLSCRISSLLQYSHASPVFKRRLWVHWLFRFPFSLSMSFAWVLAAPSEWSSGIISESADLDDMHGRVCNRSLGNMTMLAVYGYSNTLLIPHPQIYLFFDPIKWFI